MRSLLAAAFVALAPLAGCTGPEDCTVSGSSCGSYAATIAITPQSLSLAVGDTASVAVSVQQGGRSVMPDVRWTSGQPAVVALDSATVARPRARLRATSAGSSFIGLVVIVSGQTYNAAIPVTVR
jgi:uncharacterized protein YjdB